MYEYEGTAYWGNGTVREFLDINLEGVPQFPVSTSTMRMYSNYSIDGTRGIYSTLVMNAPVPLVDVGFMFAGSSYTTSTFELDGRTMTTPVQFALQGETWVDGPIETTLAVSDEASFATADGSFFNDRYSLVTTCVDEDCDQITIVQQIYEESTLEQFTVYRGTKIKDEVDFVNRIENSMVEFNIPEQIRNHSLVISNPHMLPNETFWCDELGDPSCSVSPYQNPSTGLRTGPLVGFIVLAVVIVGALIAAVERHTRKQQADRYRNVFARRIAQTIKVRAGTDRLTPELLQKEFETIATTKNGIITKDELWSFLATGKAGTIDKHDFEALFTVMDSDESGTIDFLEFCAFLADCHDEYSTAKDRKSVIATRASQKLTSIDLKDMESND